MEKIEVPPDEKAIQFFFPQPRPSGRIVAEAKDLGKSYGPKQVFSRANFVIERGDRIALVGVNGAGKSTLIKLLAGSEQPTAGELRRGHNADVDYFAQDQYKALDTQARMLDDLCLRPHRVPRKRSCAACLAVFFFLKMTSFKTIGVLSGGERKPLRAGAHAVHPSNFLLLDEPTNHLDLRAKDVLLDSLQKFTGTVVFVSHDRYFIDKLATRVFEIGEGRVEVFPGNYEDYLWRKEGKGNAPPQAPLFSASASDGTGYGCGSILTIQAGLLPFRPRPAAPVCRKRGMATHVWEEPFECICSQISRWVDRISHHYLSNGPTLCRKYRQLGDNATRSAFATWLAGI